MGQGRKSYEINIYKIAHDFQIDLQLFRPSFAQTCINEWTYPLCPKLNFIEVLSRTFHLIPVEYNPQDWDFYCHKYANYIQYFRFSPVRDLKVVEFQRIKYPKAFELVDNMYCSMSNGVVRNTDWCFYMHLAQITAATTFFTKRPNRANNK